MRVLPFLVLAVALSVAGCFGGEEAPTQWRISASGGQGSAGWAYDGVGLTPASATLDGMLDDATNTGLVNVSFTFAGVPWTAVFDTFTQGAGKDFQDGGIAFALDEHGDTGVADASIPRIHAQVAAWGTAIVSRAGVPEGGAPWTAHLMVSRDTVRGTDGKITKADGTTPYDPASPGDARRVENDAQAFLFLKHPQGETFSRGAVVTSENLTCTGPSCAQSHEVPFEAGAAGAVIDVTFRGSEANIPLPLGQGSVRILDSAGTEIGAQAFQVGANSPPLHFDVPSDAVGPLVVVVEGGGAYTAWVSSVVTYDDHPFIVLTWDEVTLAAP